MSALTAVVQLISLQKVLVIIVSVSIILWSHHSLKKINAATCRGSTRHKLLYAPLLRRKYLEKSSEGHDCCAGR